MASGSPAGCRVNLALDRYADNPIIDELVVWPPRQLPIRRVRACSVLFRKPFIEVELADGTQFQRHFARESFAAYWAEAAVILETLTDIELVCEFRFTPLPNAGALAREVLASRDDCFAEAEPMYREGLYAPYLMQFGVDYARLPDRIELMLDEARRQLHAGD